MDRRRLRSRKLAITFGVVALLLPFALAATGALVAHAEGWPVLNRAFAGVMATALLIGLCWIGLGVHGARRELQLRSESRGRH